MLMMAMALTLAAGAVEDRAALRGEAARFGVGPSVLHRALTAPVRAGDRRKATQRFCYADTVTAPGTARRVCRSREGWRRLGLEPLTE